jgi:Ribbon-helix-helix protein, copG family.
MGMRRTTLYLPEEVDLELTRLARKKGRPKAELVREALWRYLQEEAQVPAWVGLGASQDPSYIDRDEEVLAELLAREGA